MKHIIQVLGPTGVGKSKIAVRLANKIGGEIISADSMQVYKDFDIGTDKIMPEEMKGIPHHMIDIFSDCNQFNSSIFLEKSFAIAEDIVSRNLTPIVCGGTALYLKTMINGIFPEAKEKRVSRERLMKIVESVGLERMWTRLNQVDPVYAQKIGKNDKVRIVRAMEIYYNNGCPPSEIFRETRSPFSGYRFVRVGLNMDRGELYRRIERRVDEMIKRGLLEEVERLKKIYPPSCPPFKSLGYKEMLMFLDGSDICFDEAIALIKKNSRNFAKRQLSWFRQETDIKWFEPSRYDDIETWVLSALENEHTPGV